MEAWVLLQREMESLVKDYEDYGCVKKHMEWHANCMSHTINTKKYAWGAGVEFADVWNDDLLLSIPNNLPTDHWSKGGGSSTSNGHAKSVIVQ